MTRSTRPTIGVFDSGFGGLTVLRELLQQIPNADYLYLGDTAHLPYGSKSQAAVTRFTASAIRTLTAHGAEMVVIACNTASALALPSLLQTTGVPLIGVVEPGAQAAAAASPVGTVALVLATEATVASHAYAEACAAAGLSAIEKSCPLFVPLVEEGWIDGPVPEQIAEIYLREALSGAQAALGVLGEHIATAPNRLGAIVLGCTHYPLLRPLLARVIERVAQAIPIVDAAEATAQRVASLLDGTDAAGEPTLKFLATDSTAKFQRLGPLFLGRPIPHVELVTLDD